MAILMRARRVRMMTTLPISQNNVRNGSYRNLDAISVYLLCSLFIEMSGFTDQFSGAGQPFPPVFSIRITRSPNSSASFLFGALFGMVTA